MNLPPSASYNVFAHAFEKGYFFAIRVKDINVKRLLRADSLPQQMDRWADVILTRSSCNDYFQLAEMKLPIHAFNHCGVLYFIDFQISF